MFLRLFGYQFPLFLSSESAQKQAAGMTGSFFFQPTSQLLFAAVAFKRFYNQFTPEEQKDILKHRPFFSFGISI